MATGMTPPTKGATPPKPSAPKPSAMAFRKITRATAPRRMIVSIYGPEKTGKNHFAFTAPGPVGLHSFDFGTEGVVEKFVAGGVKDVVPLDIDIAEYQLQIPPGTDVQATSNMATPVWSAFTANYAIGLAKYQTSIIDTFTDAYEIIRMSYFGKLTQVMPHHYGPVNTEVKGLFRQAFSSPGKNAIYLNRHKEEWLTKTVGGKEKADKTGRMILAGYKDISYETQVHMRSFKDGDGFGMEIEACRQNPAIEGMVLQGDMFNWWTLGQLVFPDSTEEEWR